MPPNHYQTSLNLPCTYLLETLDKSMILHSSNLVSLQDMGWCMFLLDLTVNLHKISSQHFKLLISILMLTFLNWPPDWIKYLKCMFVGLLCCPKMLWRALKIIISTIRNIKFMISLYQIVIKNTHLNVSLLKFIFHYVF